MAVDLSIYLPENLSNEFWLDFLDCISDEFELLKTELLDPLKYFTYLRDQSDIDNLIEIAESYGFTPNRRVLSDANYVNLITQLVNYKIKYKSSYAGYDFIFKAINTLGYVYNLYELDSKLIRGLNATEIINVLDSGTLDFSAPFIYFYPEFYYVGLALEGDNLDEGGFLDTSGLITTLDETYITNPTKHLSIEYVPTELITVDSTEYYMTEDYLQYLLEESQYNKKTTEIPHAGFQVNSIMDLSGFFDNLSNDEYSTPDLKITCGTSVQNYFFNSEPVLLDVTPSTDPANMDFDKSSPWVLDQALPTLDFSDLNDAFYSVAVGSGSQGILSKDFPDLNSMLIAYWDFNDAGTGNIYDRGPNMYNGTLTGTYTFSHGIIGNGVSYDGSTGYGEISNVILKNSNMSFNFWFDANSTLTVGERVPLLHWEVSSTHYIFIGIDVNSGGGTEELVILMRDSIYSTSLSGVSLPLNDVETMLTVTFNFSLFTFYVYANGSLLDSQGFSSSINIAGSGDLRIATGYFVAPQNFYTGKIDEIRIYDSILSLDEMAFLYNNRIGNMNYLDDPFDELDDTDVIDNRYEDTNWYIISGIYRFYDRTSFDPDELEEEVTVSEIAIKDVSGNVVCYSTFPPATFQKKFHLAFQFYIKKST